VIVALRAAYATAGTLAEWAAAVAPRHGGKAMASLAGRRGVLARFAAWGAAHRDPPRPLIWFHAPSVGEGLQAKPIIELMRRHRPDAQIVYTHFSPSAATFAATVGADFADFLPFDTAHAARAALDAIRPTALVFSKLDLWPVLAEAAARRRVRLGMIAATLAEGSGRRGAVARALLRDAYASLDAVGAIDAGDATRLVELGVDASRVRVTGDSRYDQVWARAAAADRTSPLLAPLVSDRPTVVAGSTWPADEAPLTSAWHDVRRQLPTARMIIAPHEPTSGHLAPIEQWAARAGLRAARLDAPEAAQADLVLVDRIGVLGDLYALADVAFVGGGFHDAGLHSVLEPAAFGAPVLFGPKCATSRDALLLIAAAGGRSVTDASALGAALHRWLADADARREAGQHARDLVRAGLGAAQRSFEMVTALL